jgi:hypothetical protein
MITIPAVSQPQAISGRLPERCKKIGLLIAGAKHCHQAKQQTVSFQSLHFFILEMP